MSESWKDTFPSAGAARVMLERLARIVGKIEDRDFDGARGSLRHWDQALDFTGVPQQVRHDTDLALNTALSYLKSSPPEGPSAIRSVEEAATLWR